MYKICFSIPCHESVECVEDLILNIGHFAPNSCVVIHANKSSGQEYYDNLNRIVSKYDFAYLNSEQMEITRWGDGMVLTAHVSNYKYMKDIDYEYFWIDASNSLLINNQAESVVEGQNYAIVSNQIKKDNEWCWTEAILGDGVLKTLALRVNKKQMKIYGGPIEGTFYKKEIFKTVFDQLNPLQTLGPARYPREETYIHTIISNLEDAGELSGAHKIYCLRNFDQDALTKMLNKDFDGLTENNIITMKPFARDLNCPERKAVRNFIKGQ
jgi:hypothetical protein